MSDFSGRLRPTGRVAILVSRYNELITTKLLDGALGCCREAGLPRDAVDVIWVPGAFELAAAAAVAAHTRTYSCLVALGAVIRGDTPHFEYVCQAATEGLMQVGVTTGVPIGFGVLTCDNDPQALDRAGLPDSREDKGYESTQAALSTLAAIKNL